MNDIEILSKKYELEFRGKVRDIYKIDSNKLLIYTSDRISAFDFTFDDLIPGKGTILTKMAKFWFNHTKHIVNNHLREVKLDLPDNLQERCMVVEKTRVLPVEAIVRGHLAGSAWQTYKYNKEINGLVTEENYRQYDKLPEPIFTPSTKAEQGSKDININISEMKDIIGDELSNRVLNISIDLYNYAYEYAERKGVIIADTKFEFGLDSNNNLLLIDEIFTPDCSRFWLYDKNLKRINHDAFDKQFFRDYLVANNWDNDQITIPDDIKKKIITKYKTAYDLLTNEI